MRVFCQSTTPASDSCGARTGDSDSVQKRRRDVVHSEEIIRMTPAGPKLMTGVTDRVLATGLSGGGRPRIGWISKFRGGEGVPEARWALDQKPRVMTNWVEGEPHPYCPESDTPAHDSTSPTSAKQHLTFPAFFSHQPKTIGFPTENTDQLF